MPERGGGDKRCALRGNRATSQGRGAPPSRLFPRPRTPGVCRVRVRAPIASARNNKGASSARACLCARLGKKFGAPYMPACLVAVPAGPDSFAVAAFIHRMQALLHHCVECVQFRSRLARRIRCPRWATGKLQIFQAYQGRAMIDPDLVRRSGTVDGHVFIIVYGHFCKHSKYMLVLWQRCNLKPSDAQRVRACLRTSWTSVGDSTGFGHSSTEQL